MAELTAYGERATFFLFGLVTALIILDLILIAATAYFEWQTRKILRELEAMERWKDGE